jgi:type-F conjugative transfer system pilin assembly protein TrbC
MIARTLASALLVASSTFAQAQEPTTAPSISAIESLMDAQRARAATAINDASRSALMPKRAPVVDMDRAVQMGGADPLAIAKQYEQGLRAAPQEALYIFISTSIPIDTLKLLGEQAVRGGAALVLRGIPGGFDGYTNMLQTLKPVIATGADIQIHPELFDRFEVTSVPAFVIAKYRRGLPRQRLRCRVDFRSGRCLAALCSRTPGNPPPPSIDDREGTTAAIPLTNCFYAHLGPPHERRPFFFFGGALCMMG